MSLWVFYIVYVTVAILSYGGFVTWRFCMWRFCIHTKIDSKKRKTIDTTDTFDTSKKRKIAQGCHVCGDSFSKGTVKKKCVCRRFCHKNCVGKCIDVLSMID